MSGELRDNECSECGHLEQTRKNLGDGNAYCCSECGNVWKVGKIGRQEA